MKIVQVIAPSPVGGAEQVVVDLCGALAGEGAEVHLLAVLDADRSEPDPFLDAALSRVAVHRLEVRRRAYLRERGAIADLLRDIGPDVVHTHGYRADVIAGSACRAVGVPTVSTAHGFTGGGARNRLYEYLQRRTHRKLDAVVAVSRPLAAALRNSGVPGDRIATIPNARSAPRDPLAPGEARARLGASPDCFHVGFVGRLSHEKGPDLVLDALGRLVDLPFEATFVGAGPAARDLTDQALSIGIDDRVRWAGVVPHASRFLRGFDVLVLGSRTEGTPIVVLEGMAAGVPLVATQVGGVPDMLSEREALLVPPESPAALARAIRSVHARPDSAESRALAAKSRFEELSATDRWARRHLALYRSVTDPAGQRPSSLARVSIGGTP